MALQWPIERLGTQGENVRSIQYFLKAHGQAISVDGDFGQQTDAAVRSFQSAHGLTVDGIVGTHTWLALLVEVSSGSQGDAVKALQSQVDSRGAGGPAVDGIFGPPTQTAVQEFQQILGLTVDGIAGPVTWNSFVDGYLPGPGPVRAAESVYHAWTQNDRGAARKNATPSAVAALFGRSWSPSAGWNFAGSQGAAGTVYCTWKCPGGQQLDLGAIDGITGYFYVQDVSFQ